MSVPLQIFEKGRNCHGPRVVKFKKTSLQKKRQKSLDFQKKRSKGNLRRGEIPKSVGRRERASPHPRIFSLGKGDTWETTKKNESQKGKEWKDRLTPIPDDKSFGPFSEVS